jgi:hypothetical protein
LEGFLIGYTVFCIATAITAAITLLSPTLEKLYVNQPNNILVDNVPLTYIVFVVLAILVAPILLLPALTGSDTFKNSLYYSVKD